MTDWCSNYIEVTFTEKSNIEDFLSFIIDGNNELSFDVLIPMPAILRKVSTGSRNIGGVKVTAWIEEDGETRALSDDEAEQIAKTGYASWYDWSIANWGTKWGAHDTVVIDDGRGWGVLEIKFETAWAPPYPIFAKLHEIYPDVSFEFRYRLADDHSYPHLVTPSDISQQIPSLTEILYNMQR